MTGTVHTGPRGLVKRLGPLALVPALVGTFLFASGLALSTPGEVEATATATIELQDLSGNPQGYPQVYHQDYLNSTRIESNWLDSHHRNETMAVVRKSDGVHIRDFVIRCNFGVLNPDLSDYGGHLTNHDAGQSEGWWEATCHHF